MDEPLKDQVRDAFGSSTAVVWQVLTGIAVIGMVASWFMQDLSLPKLKDDKWQMEKPSGASSVQTLV